ncbi:CHAD domain-containing protein [Curtobacterium sp. MCPF17_002]|uniref:CHAD domain-containing protein n=1 Tax=Curtobacterium sp. MCPF17_002 TaxID=2175645 RepID=UPI0011B5ACDC|nr:CHAD domain-containing protein [Curtobacterium sp. MCPF17_002]WIB77069.1 CHAD domain-containing protein [Curtobacterium sp. MCPF17_002]
MPTQHPGPEARSDPRCTWRIPDDRRLPALEPFADAVLRHDPVVLRETVWDTDDRTLAAEGVELLRSDLGWSVDRGDGPVAVGPDLDGDPLDAGAVPRDAVEVFLRGRELGVTRVRGTETTLVELRGRDGRLRAEVADVRVDEGDPDTALLRSARWWALSDDGHGGTVARATERALADAADPAEAHEGRASSTPAEAVRSEPGRLEPARLEPARLEPVRRRGASKRPRRGTAAAVVREVLRSLRADLVAVDPRVRGDERESVHDLRKVLRRLRSVLAAFRGALDPGATDTLRAELAEVARVAGTARDAEVLRDRLLRTAARTPEGYVDATTLDRIGTHVDELRTEAATDLRRTMRSPVWFSALDHLDDLIERAPKGPHADEDAAAFVVRRIGKERLRVTKTVEGPVAGLDELHEVRKAARRLRYALQAARGAPDLGKRRLGFLKRVQESLGEVLDAAHATAAYRQLAVVAARNGEDTFGYGALATTEHAAVEQAWERARKLLAKV